MNDKFFKAHDKEADCWTIWERTNNGDRVVADNIPDILWAEAMENWANGLELVPTLHVHREGE